MCLPVVGDASHDLFFGSCKTLTIAWTYSMFLSFCWPDILTGGDGTEVNLPTLIFLYAHTMYSAHYKCNLY